MKYGRQFSCRHQPRSEFAKVTENNSPIPFRGCSSVRRRTALNCSFERTNKYVMHFPKGQLPSGGDKEANRLPTPAGKFVLILRMYWPDEKRRRSLTGPGNCRRSRRWPDWTKTLFQCGRRLVSLPAACFSHLRHLGLSPDPASLQRGIGCVRQSTLRRRRSSFVPRESFVGRRV